MTASLLVVFPGSDMDVYSNGGRAGVFVGVVCRNCGPVRHFKLDTVSSEPMLVYKYSDTRATMVKPVSCATNNARCCRVGQCGAVTL